MEYPSVSSLRARCVFCPKPPCVGVAGGADRARRRSTRRKSLLGRGRRNKRRYLSGDHGRHVRGSNQLSGGGRRGHTAHKAEIRCLSGSDGLASERRIGVRLSPTKQFPSNGRIAFPILIVCELAQSLRSNGPWLGFGRTLLMSFAESNTDIPQTRQAHARSR